MILFLPIQVSTCQLEVTTRFIPGLLSNDKFTFILDSYQDLLICDTVGDRQKYAPLRVLSFDLECNVPPGVDQFPNACNDPIFQITSMVSYHGTYFQALEGHSAQSSGYRSINSVHPNCLYCGFLCPHIRNEGYVLQNRSWYAASLARILYGGGSWHSYRVQRYSVWHTFYAQTSLNLWIRLSSFWEGLNVGVQLYLPNPVHW